MPQDDEPEEIKGDGARELSAPENNYSEKQPTDVVKHTTAPAETPATDEALKKVSDSAPPKERLTPVRWIQTNPHLEWLEKPRTVVAATGLLLSGGLSVFGATVLTMSITPGQGTAIGGAAVLTGAALTYYSNHQTRVSHENTSNNQLNHAREELAHERDKTVESARNEIGRDLRARFTSATEQMGSLTLAPRLAGVYALAALADDWFAYGSPKERQVCIDMLCAYVRRSKNDSDPPSSDDEQVRATIIAVIADRTRMPVDGAEGPWQNCKFNFADALLPTMNLQNCRFSAELDFSRTNFEGALNLSGSVLAFTRFNHAVFNRGAAFRGTHFGNRVDLNDAIFSTSADFKRAKFHGHTDFSQSTVDHALLSFRSAFFKPGSTTLFRHIMLKTDARLDFSNGWFQGGDVDLRNAQIQIGAVIRFRSPRKWVNPPKGDWVNEPSPEYLDPPTWPPPLYSSREED